MRDLLKKALSKSSASYADAYYEDRHALSITYAGKKLKDVSTTSLEGGRLRALKSGGMAYSSFTDMKKIDECLKSAEITAKAMGSHQKRPIELAPAPVIDDIIKAEPEIDPRKISFDEKRNLTQKYNELILSQEKVQTTLTSYHETVTNKYFVNTEGTKIEQEVILCRIGARIVAKNGTTIQSTGISLGYDEDYKKLLDRESDIARQAKITVDLLDAEPVKGGVYTILCNPFLAGIFTHEAFGHLSEADSLYDIDSILDIMKIGKVLGNPILNIVDQGNLKGASGTYKYDDEGIPTQKTYLIKDGILSGRLLSREMAAIFGGKPTGNFRATDYRVNPIVRMSNIFIENGESKFEDMLESIDDGFYLCQGKGGQTMGDLFTFGAQYGYKIKNGKLGKMVRDINISGNVFTTLKNIVAVGNDFEIIETGGCGKSKAGLFYMQMLDKSGMLSPHVKIKDLVIGGKE
ncbi:TldD/PmbA family protein [bacterium]|nr:TldD/PmbA family protein [bacterium]